MLEKYDIEVDMAESAEQAIEYLNHNRPDAIFNLEKAAAGDRTVPAGRSVVASGCIIPGFAIWNAARSGFAFGSKTRLFLSRERAED